MSERVYEVLLLVITLTLLIQTIRYSLLRKVKTALEKTFASYRRKMDPLEKFRDVLDADVEASRIRSLPTAACAAMAYVVAPSGSAGEDRDGGNAEVGATKRTSGWRWRCCWQ